MLAGLHASTARAHTTLDSPVATVQEFLFHLSHGSLAVLFELLPARLVRQAGREALAAILSSSALQIRRRGGLRRVTYSGDPGDTDGGREALVSSSMVFAYSTVDRSMLVVVREDGGWKVDLAR